MIGLYFSEESESVKYIKIKYQEPPIQFLNQFYSSSFLGNISPIILTYLVFLGFQYLWTVIYPFKQQKGYMELKKHGQINALISIFMITLQHSFIILTLQASNVNFYTQFNIISFVLFLIYGLCVAGGLASYFRAAFTKEEVVYDTSSKSKMFAFAFFHKLPLMRSVSAKNYGTLWIIYKAALVILLYRGKLMLVAVFSLLNPVVMAGMDTF